MISFKAKILKIGVNPYVLPPRVVLQKLFGQAGRDKGPLPISVTLNGHTFLQTLVKYSGKWRLYLNTPMRKAANIDVGDWANVKLEYDPLVRTSPMPVKLEAAMAQNKKALQIFNRLSLSRRKEIMRYIGSLKSDEAVDKNVIRAIQFLLGKQRFMARDKP